MTGRGSCFLDELKSRPPQLRHVNFADENSRSKEDHIEFIEAAKKRDLRCLSKSSEYRDIIYKAHNDQGHVSLMIEVRKKYRENHEEKQTWTKRILDDKVYDLPPVWFIIRREIKQPVDLRKVYVEGFYVVNSIEVGTLQQ